MYIIYVVDIDYHNNVNNNTLFSKLEKEVYFKLVAKSNLALDVLFRFNSKSIFLKIIPVFNIDALALMGLLLIKCKTQYKFLQNILHLRSHKQFVVSKYSKLPMMLLEFFFRNSKLYQIFFQTTNSLTENVPAIEGCTIVKMEG